MENGLQINGIQNNGAYINGLSLNSMAPNGIGANGLPLNGLPLNGLLVNGLPLNGLPLNGIGANGLPLNGLPLNGLYVNGLPLNGLPLNGLPLNGLYVNGLPLNGLFVNGLPLNGLGLNGLPLNGLLVNGLYSNGLPLNGLFVNGLPLNGLPLNGLYVNGAVATTAIKIADIDGQLVNLNSSQETQFEAVMAHLAKCALADGDSLTVYDSSGAPVSYPGTHGLAPEWKSSPAGLGARDPNGIDNEEEIRWCLEHYRMVDANNNVYPGLALNEEQQAQLEVLLKYAIECALDATQSVTIQFPTAAITFYGALGLAPSWQTGALDTTGQKAVTACLGARTNALGKTVRISLRGPSQYEGLATSAVERRRFGTHEGAFWGNVFGDAPELHACKDQGGGPSGRLCTDGSCGFTPDPLPDCSDTTNGCDTKDAEGNWTSCGVANEPVVLNTYLMTENALAGSSYHSCARRVDGTVWCWGMGAQGQLGHGMNTNSIAAVKVLGLPSPVDPTQASRQVRSGTDFACSRNRDGRLWCWGFNGSGQLGDGTLTNRSSAVPVLALGADDSAAANLSLGTSHACAVKMDGTLWCWGHNNNGQLGDGTTTNRPYPVQVTLLGNQVIEVKAGSGHTCALKMDGTMWCWGANWAGELGNDSLVDSASPVQAGAVALGNGVVDISAGGNHTCAVKADGTLWCWGYNTFGAVGDGTSVNRPSPVQIGALVLSDQVATVSTGTNHTCAVKADGSLWCWGYNTYGQLGDNTTTHKYSPVQVPFAGSATNVLAGPMATFAEAADGKVWSWGANGYGILGDGTTNRHYSPYRMSVLINRGDGVCDFSESSIEEAADCAGSVPTTPASVSSSVISQTSITIAWPASNDDIGVTGYKVFKDSVQVGTTAERTYTFFGLTCNTVYWLGVSAYDADGNSSGQATVGVLTSACPADTSAPTTPTGLTKSGITPNAITLSWTASTDNVGVAGYKVFMAGSQVATVAASPYTFSGLTCNTAYSLTVSAYDAAGNTSAQATAVSGTTSACDTTKPTKPTGLTTPEITQTSVKLSWTASTDNVGVTGYKVFKGSTQVASVTASPYTFTGLTCNTAYSFTVSAFDAAGNNSFKATAVSRTTSACAGDTTAPTVPTGLASSGITQAAITLSWTASTDSVGVTGYKVYKGGTLVTTVTASPYTVTGLNCGRSYALTVSAYDAAGNNSAQSTALSVATAACTLGIGTESAGVDSNGVGLAEAVGYTSSPTGATISKLCVFLDASSTASAVILGVYSHTGSGQGHPYQLKTAGTIAAPVANAWNCVAVTSYSVPASTKHWLAVLQPSGSTGAIRFRDGGAGGGMEWMSSGSISALPATWPTTGVGSDGNGNLSCFATP